MSRAKHWCFTVNNPTEVERSKLVALDGDRTIEYLVFGNEVGESGTPHLQGFVAYCDRVRLTQLKQTISARGISRLRSSPRRLPSIVRRMVILLSLVFLLLRRVKDLT